MTRRRFWPELLCALGLTLGPGAGPLRPAPPSEPETLRLAIIVMRHGVRSPTESNGDLDRYSSLPWPAWGVPRGDLTPRGRRLLTLLGAYYRDRFVASGLLSGHPAEDRSLVFFRADNVERTIESAHGLAEGLVGTGVDLHLWPRDEPDPLFKPVTAFVEHPDRAGAAAAVRRRIGDASGALTPADRAALQTLNEILLGRGAGRPPPGKISLLGQTVVVRPGANDSLVAIRGSLGEGARLAEALLLEYAEGMPEVGWGRVTGGTLADLLELRAASFDLAERTFLPAQEQGSNLASHILGTLEQAVDDRPRAGALGTPSDRLVVVVGHDGNLANLGGLLGLSWRIGGQPENPTLPGGALVFELWRRGGGACFVRADYIAQTLDQMREGRILTLGSPPAVAPIVIPGTVGSGPDFEVPFGKFQNQLRSAIDPQFVSPR